MNYKNYVYTYLTLLILLLIGEGSIYIVVYCSLFYRIFLDVKKLSLFQTKYYKRSNYN